jgi:hypothetical protein
LSCDESLKVAKIYQHELNLDSMKIQGFSPSPTYEEEERKSNGRERMKEK